MTHEQVEDLMLDKGHFKSTLDMMARSAIIKASYSEDTYALDPDALINTFAGAARASLRASEKASSILIESDRLAAIARSLRDNPHYIANAIISLLPESVSSK